MQSAIDRTRISSEQWNEFQSCPRKKKILEGLYTNGQIIVVELEVRKLKLIMQDEINMFREDGE